MGGGMGWRPSGLRFRADAGSRYRVHEKPYIFSIMRGPAAAWAVLFPTFAKEPHDNPY